MLSYTHFFPFCNKNLKLFHDPLNLTITEGTNSAKLHSYTQKAFVFINLNLLLDKYKKKRSPSQFITCGKTGRLQQTMCKKPVQQIQEFTTKSPSGMSVLNSVDSVFEASIQWNVCVIQYYLHSNSNIVCTAV